LLKPGDITFRVLARSETNEFGRHVYASLGLARPTDPDMYGYISELHGYGMTAEASREQAEDLAATMLASSLGLDFDPEAAWNERKQIYEHSSLIIDSTSITAAAEWGRDNHWICGIASAVFLFS
jgi:arginine decarboxylase